MEVSVRADSDSKMATANVNYPMECRVIVDDVDEDRLHQSKDERYRKSKAEDDGESSENPTDRIRQIQVEAESRKMEFARLLEEHAQVVKTLKQMEAKESPRLLSDSAATKA